jgi:type I restriction enzyme S subunit
LTTELRTTVLHHLLAFGLSREPQKQTEIGPVPESWQIAELGNVASLFGGYAFKSEESITGSNTQLVRMGNLYKSKLDLNRSAIFYPDEFAQKYSRFVLHPGELIMSPTGTTGKEDYGFTVEVPAGQKALLLNQRVAKIEPTSKDLTKEFLLYFLLSRKFLDHLYPTAKGMKQANLSTHAMKRLKLPIPSIDEQNQISSSLKTIDFKIALHEAKLNTLRNLFRTLLHQLMMAQFYPNAEMPELEIVQATHA